jgi:hypothetical protein
MAVTTYTNPSTRGINTLSFDQAAAGTDTLIAAPGADNRIVICGVFVSLSSTGVVEFRNGSTDRLLGQWDMSGNSAVGFNGTMVDPVVELSDNQPLVIVTSGGAASGFIKYFTTSST